MEKMERETGIEPATSSLGSWHSTTELLPPVMTVAAEIVALWATLLNLSTFGLVNTQRTMRNFSSPHCLFESCSDVAAATVRCY